MTHNIYLTNSINEMYTNPTTQQALLVLGKVNMLTKFVDRYKGYDYKLNKVEQL